MVYAIQESKGKNILPAEKFGKIVVMLDQKATGTYIVPPETYTTLRKILRHFNDEDYLLLIGDPILIGIATAIALKENFGTANVLRWDKQEKKYVALTITY